MDQDALIPLPPQDLGDLRDQPELQALLANPALMNHPQIAQLYAQFQQDQANLMNLPPLPPLPPVSYACCRFYKHLLKTLIPF